MSAQHYIGVIKFWHLSPTKMPSLTPVSYYRSRKNNSARNGSSECSKLALAVESGKDSDISRPSLLLPASLHLPADSLALNYRRNPYDLWRQSAAARSAAVLVVYSSSRRCVVEPESQTAKTLVLLPHSPGPLPPLPPPSHKNRSSWADARRPGGHNAAVPPFRR